MIRSVSLVGLVALISAGLGGCQSLDTGAISPMPDNRNFTAVATIQAAAHAVEMPNEQANTPPGFIGFCLRFSDQCSAPDDTPKVVELSASVWRLVQQVNGKVNGDISPLTDEAHYGRQEYWTIPTDGYGDCEDYALTKRQALAKAGIPGKSLRITIVLTPQDTRHAVLTVVTDKGDYVLDNLTNTVLPWNETNYRGIERQDGEHPWQWVSLMTPNDRRYVASLGWGDLAGSIN